MHEKNFNEVSDHTTLGLINFMTRKKNGMGYYAGNKSLDLEVMSRILKKGIAENMKK
jgi:hypothetical protein